MKIYLIRHGETDWNKERRVQGSADIPLNAYGLFLAKKTAEGLQDVPFDVVYSSPLIRARQTAEILRGKREIPVYIDDRLQEMGFGRYEGTDIQKAGSDSTDKLHDFIRHPERYKAEDGEDFSQVIERAKAFIEEVLVGLERQYETVMITAHGAFIRCFLRCVEERPLAEFWSGIPQGNCSVNILEMKCGRLFVREEGRLYYEVEESEDAFAKSREKLKQDDEAV